MNSSTHKQLTVPAMLAVLGLLATPVARADFSNSVMALNPAGYWMLNETTQPPAAVSPTASNLGTLGAEGNAAFVGDTVFGHTGALAGTTDSADSFNGFETQANVPYNAAIAKGPSFTIEAWLLAYDDGTLWGTTCPLSDFDANSPRSGWLIYQDISNVGQLTFRAYNQNGTTPSLNLDLGAPGSIQIEKWYHLAVVVSNAVTVTNVYGFINGALVAGPVALPAYVPNDGLAGAFSIGGRSDGGFDYSGAIDEVAYYTNALDASTILSHYQAGTNPAPATAYSTLVQQSNPLLYFRMNETPVGQPYPVALPVAANRGSMGAAANGYYQPGTVPGVAGPTNSGFGPLSKACSFTPGGAQGTSQGGPGVLVAPYGQAALNFNQAVTLAAWIRVPIGTPWFETPIGRGDASYRFDVDAGGLPHFAANPNGDVIGTFQVNDGAWHFWAGVFDPVTTKSSLYIDSLLAAEAPGNPLANLTCYLLIGGAPDYNDRNFYGDIAHVALFTNALSGAQIANLYNSVGAAPSVFLATNAITINSGGNGGITATVAGTPPLTVQWYFITTANVTNLAVGQTAAALSLTNVQVSQDQSQYFVTVSNAYGAVTSSIVTLTVAEGPPTIQVDLTPAAQQVPVGATVSYSVQVTGTEPFHFQWFRDSAAVSGATNPVYAFPATSGTHTYSVTITNNFGPANSAVVSLTGVSTPPPVVTFNVDGTGWTLNHNAENPTLAIANGSLLLTSGTNSQVGAAFFNTPQYSDGFAAFFTYQEADGTAPLADGATFCIQNSSAGASAIGGGGGELGFTGIGNSAAFLMNIYSGSPGGQGIQFGTNGMTANSPVKTLPYFSCAPVNLASGHPINVQLYCSQGTWHLKLVDATSGDTYLTSVNLGDMRSTIGADSGYVGFTGACGGLNSIQTVSNFRFSYTTPPILAAAKTGSNLVLSWPVSVATFFKLQQSGSLAGPWANVPGSPTIVGLENQMTVPATGPAQFYRLELQ